MATSRPPVGHHPVATQQTVKNVGNKQVVTRHDGKIATIHDPSHNMDIHHGLNGNRHVEVERADHSRIVADRRGGYVDHRYTYGGRDYSHRTYYYNGRVYDRYYGSYYYNGVYVNYYTPSFYYAPAYYGWAYNPWVAPVSYAWGWAGNPWYGYYGSYFTPYPVYASASLWLTDYLISQSLIAAYQAQQDVAANAVAAAQEAPAGAVPLTPEVKEMIAAEVKNQIALEYTEAQNGQAAAPNPASSSIQRLLTDGAKHVFVVGTDLDLVDAAGTECAVSQGDALQLAEPPAAAAAAATLVVLSGKGGHECQRGDTVTVQLTDLQDMQNHMRETIDAGMGELKAKQGSGNLPAAPAATQGPQVKANFVSAAPAADPNVASELKEQTQIADAAEQQVTQGTPDGAAQTQVATAVAPPAEVSIGQSIDQVTSALGQPTSKAVLATKTIYIYPNMKVFFKAGKVSDVE